MTLKKGNKGGKVESNEATRTKFPMLFLAHWLQTTPKILKLQKGTSFSLLR